MDSNRRRWALALATASLAVAGLGTSSAHAGLGPPCSGDSIEGGGSSTQATAQSIWTLGGTAGSTVGFNTDPGGCTGAGAPTARYTPSNSGTCLSWFGADATFDGTSTHFCGTDAPPSTAELATMRGASTSPVLTVPVAQLAIAILINPPTNCTVTGATRGQIEAAFRVDTTTWTTLSGTGPACDTHITKIVRADTSGTTYQFKHWLGTINMGVVHNGTTWTDLQDGDDNLTWPGTYDRSQAGCLNKVMSLPCETPVTPGVGGTDEARTVATAPGSIGYAALPDARGITIDRGSTFHKYKWLKVLGTGVFASTTFDPSTNGLSATRGQSSCATTSGNYGTLPTVTASWANTYYSAAGVYPICTLTWNLALTEYGPQYGATGPAFAATVRDYLHYVLQGGQVDALITNNDYAPLPFDVKTAGTAGLADITG